MKYQIRSTNNWLYINIIGYLLLKTLTSSFKPTFLRPFRKHELTLFFKSYISSHYHWCMHWGVTIVNLCSSWVWRRHWSTRAFLSSIKRPFLRLDTCLSLLQPFSPCLHSSFTVPSFPCNSSLGPPIFL